MSSVQCPHCGKVLKVSEKLAGKTGRCPSCSRAFQVPAAPPPPTPLPPDPPVSRPEPPPPPPMSVAPQIVSETPRRGKSGRSTVGPLPVALGAVALVLLALVVGLLIVSGPPGSEDEATSAAADEQTAAASGDEQVAVASGRGQEPDEPESRGPAPGDPPRQTPSEPARASASAPAQSLEEKTEGPARRETGAETPRPAHVASAGEPINDRLRLVLQRRAAIPGVQAVSGDGRRALGTAGDNDRHIVVWGEQGSRRLQVGYRGQQTLAISPDGRIAISVTKSDRGYHFGAWELETGDQKANSLWTWEVNDVVLSPEGRLALMGGSRTIMLWHVDLKTSLGTFEPLAGNLALSSGGRRGVGSRGATVLAWDLSEYVTPEALADPGALRFTHASELTGHRGKVLSLAVSADGRYAVSGGDDGTARVWDLRGRREVQRFEGHTGAVYSVAFTSNTAEHVVSGGEDQTIRLWHAQSGHEIHNVEGQEAMTPATRFSCRDDRLAVMGGSSVAVWKVDADVEPPRIVASEGGGEILGEWCLGFSVLVQFQPDGKVLVAEYLPDLLRKMEAWGAPRKELTELEEWLNKKDDGQTAEGIAGWGNPRWVSNGRAYRFEGGGTALPLFGRGEDVWFVCLGSLLCACDDHGKSGEFRPLMIQRQTYESCVADLSAAMGSSGSNAAPAGSKTPRKGDADPIIGKWGLVDMTWTPGIGIEFKADGTIDWFLDWHSWLSVPRSSDTPLLHDAFQWAWMQLMYTELIRHLQPEAQSSWTREGNVYRIQHSEDEEMYLTCRGDRFVPCNKKGKPKPDGGYLSPGGYAR